MSKERTFLSQALVSDSEQVAEGKGKNIIPKAPPVPLWKAYLAKFQDPIIVILLVVFCFSVGVSLYEAFYLGKSSQVLIEPLGILFALLLATGVGFAFEVKAQREFEILNTVRDSAPVKVYRKPHEGTEARLCEVEKHDVCIGDYVYLESGDEIPADGVLDETRSLLVDESNFTGEPYTHKSAYAEEFDAQATYPSNQVLRGSTVTEGTAIFHVTAVGMQTVEGRGVAITREGSEVKTPLNRQLDGLGAFISRVSFILALLIVVGRICYFFFVDDHGGLGYDWLQIAEFALSTLMLAVTLIVVAVPEGLPMSVTVSLALSMRKMLKEQNLVRKLHACETMGATTVICTDKTGTLTQNRMSVVSQFFCGEGAEERVRLNMALNSTAELTSDEKGRVRPLGNPTEGALLLWLQTKGVAYEALRCRYRPGVGEPFSSERKYMSMEFTATDTAAVPGTRRHIRLIKGAPEKVLAMARESLSSTDLARVQTELHTYQSKAMRTLAFASQYEEGGQWSPLCVDGIVGIADPIRPQVPAAISDCVHRAGVRVIMVTGDTQGTALEIARQIGLLSSTEHPDYLSGEAFAALTDAEAMARIESPSFCLMFRARPEDKARLVMLLQRGGEVVAVTGDGTNDAPALSKAQVGLSMGDGTARAKEASDITILDNSFTSIVTAIVWGRSIYQNIRRFILFQMIINVCACMVVLAGAFTGLDSPLNVTQMLWVNLIMDTFAAIALSSLPADREVLDQKPRNQNSSIISGRMGAYILSVGILFFLLLMALWQLLWHCDIDRVSDLFATDKLAILVRGFFDMTKSKPHLSTYELSVFFTFFVLLQFWNLFNARYYLTRHSLLGDLVRHCRSSRGTCVAPARGFMVVAWAILLGQILIVSCFYEFFGISPLSLADWLWLLLITSPVLWIGEVVRVLRHGIK